jgi:cbb3-type cytochrome oxidase subunit 3
MCLHDIMLNLLSSGTTLPLPWVVYAVLYWFWRPEIGTSSIDRAQLSRLLLKDGDKSIVSEILFSNNKNRAVDNVQKANNCK